MRLRKLIKIVLALAVCCTSAGLHAGDFGSQTGTWNGYAQYNINVNGRDTRIVAPAVSLEGNPWVMRAVWAETAIDVDVELLSRGYHVVYMDPGAYIYGSPTAVSMWDGLYQEMTQTHDFADKAILIGGSRGALQAYNWGALNVDKTQGIYCTVPVCDIKSWPGRWPESTQWAAVMNNYGFATNEEAFAWLYNPVDTIGAFAVTDIPIANVGGSLDDSAPPDANAQLLYDNYTALGGSEMQLTIMPGAIHGTAWDAYKASVGGNMDGIVDHITSTPPPTPPTPTAPGIALSDTFNTVSTGINVDLATRQGGSEAAQTYSFVGGSSSTAEISADELLITSNAQGPQTVYTDWDGGGLAGLEYSVSADFLFQPNTGSLDAHTWGSLVINESQSSDIVASLDLMLLLRANGTWIMYTGGTEVDSGTIDGSSSYHVELAVDETGDSNTFDFIVDGTTLVDDAAWTAGGSSRYTGMRYYGYAGTYEMAFDDFTVTVAGKLGDANRDGAVDVTDLGILATNYGAGSGFGWNDGDFTGDGVVDVNDLGILATEYGNASSQSVPEPSSLALLMVVMVLLVFWRRAG